MMMMFVCVLLMCLVVYVNGHAFMIVPASRNQVAYEKGLNYCPHCMSAGGVNTVQANDPNDYWVENLPPGPDEEVRHGLCGDPVNDQQHMPGGANYFGTITASYTAGSSIDITIDVRTHHHGWFEFRLCDMDSNGGVLSQACLNENLLERDPNDPSESPIDANFPGRYYMIPKCAPNAMMQTIRYKLPDGLTCDHCVLQYWWVTANTCYGGGYDGVDFPNTYTNCFGDGGASGWYPRSYPSDEALCKIGDSRYPEEFWNCADISIVTGSPTAPTNGPSPTTSPPTQSGTTPTMSPPTPTENPSDCDRILGYDENCESAPSCCPAGATCYRKNQWWSGCLSSCTAGMIDDYDDLPWECTVVDGSATNPPTDGDVNCADKGIPSVSALGFANRTGPLKLNGVQLSDENDQPVQLYGYSSHGLQWFGESCTKKEAIQNLVEKYGTNVFRASMYIGENGYATNPTYNKNKVKEIVQWCIELGVYVVIDWHVLTPGDPNTYLDYEGAPTGMAIDFFTEMAQLYKDTHHVIFELANEPNGVAWSSVKAYHNSLISAIRTIDQDVIIICGTTTWSQDVHLAAADPVDQPHHVMYAFHFYAGTHASLYSRLQTQMQMIPIFVSEWGASDASGYGNANLPVAKQFLDLMTYDDSGIKLSFCKWSFADLDAYSAALNPSACSRNDWDDLTCSGQFTLDYIKSIASSSSPTTEPPVPSPTTEPPVPNPTTAPPVPNPTTEPPVPNPTTEPPVPNPTTEPPTTIVVDGCGVLWSQCGGAGFTGTTSCCEGSMCVYSNEWYSQCLPDPNRTCQNVNEGCLDKPCCPAYKCAGNQYWKMCYLK